MNEEMGRVFRLIALERARQDAKWGQQNHDAQMWLVILTEELGEVSQSYLQQDRVGFVAELTQAAAVMVAWLECELRK